MADGGQLTEYTGPFAWAVPLAISIAGGIAGALNLRGRVAGLEARLSAMEELASKEVTARAALRDEVLAKLRELGAEIRKDLADRPPDSMSLPGLQGLVDNRVQAAVTAAMADANEKYFDRLISLGDRVSEITGTVKAMVGRGR